jgi:hypothetical protein
MQTVSKALATSRKTAPVGLFRQSSRLLFQRIRPNARTCYARVETPTARLTSARDRSLHIRS